MVLLPLVGLDLGAVPAVVLVTGTDRVPVLLEARRFPAWDSEAVVAQIAKWLERWPGAVVYCEETFSAGTRGAKPWLRDVGRRQEGQAGYLEGMLSTKQGFGGFERVPACDGSDADKAWLIFGQPEEGRGPKGEHVRDGLAVALKALIRRRERVRA